MRFLAFLLFVLLPIIEIALFIVVGREIGVLATIGLVILAAVAGAAIVRRQGMQALDRLRAAIETGRDPAGPIAHGALIMIAGVLLMIPGFFTDILGLLLLLPPVRRLLIRGGASRMTVRAATYVRPGPARQPSEIIEAEYEVLDEPPRRPGGSGWTRPDG